LPLPLQVKLLRVLQEKEVIRIGSRKGIPVNVRLVTATNVDLDFAVSAGHFRRDLLYRINIAQLKLPPLRERPGDITPLAKHFLKTYGTKMGYQQPVFSVDAIELLLNYSWPGNIRELENVIHFALLVASGEVIEPEHLKVTGGWNTYTDKSTQLIQQPTSNHPTQRSGSSSGGNYGGNDPMKLIAVQLKRLFEEQGDGPHFNSLESLIVHEAFHHVRSNQVHAASLLGISRNVMRTLLKRHGLLGDLPAFATENTID
jgi:DNA-binding NtrC family response regulator